MMSALSDIEKLVAEVAKDALKDGSSLECKMDALKLLTPYYAVLKKAKGKSDDEPGDEPTMGQLRSRLRVVEQEPGDGGVETAGGGGGNG